MSAGKQFDKSSVTVRFNVPDTGSKGKDWTGLAIGSADWELAIDTFLGECDAPVYRWLASLTAPTKFQQEYRDEYVKRIFAGAFPAQRVENNEPQEKKIVTMVTLAEYNQYKARVTAAEAAVKAALAAKNAAQTKDNAAAAQQATVSSNPPMGFTSQVVGTTGPQYVSSLTFVQANSHATVTNKASSIKDATASDLNSANTAYEDAQKALQDAQDALSRVRPPVLNISLSSSLNGNVGTNYYAGSSGPDTLESQVSVSFYKPPDPQPVTCGLLPYMLFHTIDSTFANNKCCEVILSGGQSSGSGQKPKTAEEILRSCLVSVSVQLNRAVEYGVTFKLTGNPPQELLERMGPMPTAIQYDFEAWPQPPVADARIHSWTCYIELIHTDTGSVWWVSYYLPFPNTWTGSNTKDQGRESRTIDAYNLFVNYPGQGAKLALDEWVDTVGPEGYWIGRVVLEDSMIRPMAADIEIEGKLVAEGRLFPGAPFYLAKTAHVPGYGTGIRLCR